MTKWGVRIIGVIFLLWAFTDLLELVTGTHPSTGFMGIKVSMFTTSANSFDIMAYVGVYITAYIGYHLLRFDPQGRKWALIILWPATILAGIFLLLAMVGSILSLRQGTDLSPKLSFLNPQLPLEFEGFTVVILLGLFFIFYLIQTWFLMRKDVKSLFLKTDAILEQAS